MIELESYSVTRKAHRMAKRIALFNHKGGVSKTTTTFNLGWMLASKGKTVILVDSDPQANLTGLVMGYKGPSELADFYSQESDRNLKAGLAPAFESRPSPMQAVDCLPVETRDRLFLVPGHIGLSEYEVTLGIAQELSGSIQTLQNLPGSISALLQMTAEQFKADYILVDMNPSLSAFNQNLLMTSDYFILPTNPDFFSVMAIDSLCNVFPKWASWSEKASSMDILKNAVYPFPKVTPKFIGTIIQNYRPRGGAPAQSFQVWVDQINKKVSKQLVPTLRDIGMALPRKKYRESKIEDYCLAKIPDFNSLIAKSQDAQTPVFALTAAQIGQGGSVLQRSEASRDSFEKNFSELADKVIDLTDDADSD